MTLDASGNLGVGTTSPSTYGKFVAYSSGGYGSIDSNGFISSAQLLDTATAGGRFSGYSSRGLLGSIKIEQAATGADGGYMAFGTCASGSTTYTERARIDSSGNLGLGVTPSAWSTSFSIKAFDISGGSVYSAATDISTVLNAYFNSSNAWIYKTTNPASRYTQGSGQHQWYTAPSGTAGNAITFTQAMTLDASGNLGVGTTSPSQRLHLAIGSATAIYNRIQNSAGDCYLGLDTSGNTNLSADNAGNQLIFKTEAVERMRLDTSGNLGLGVTPSAWDSLFKVLQLGGGAFLGQYNANAFQVGLNTYFNGCQK